MTITMVMTMAQQKKGDGDHHHGIYNMHLWLSPEISAAFGGCNPR